MTIDTILRAYARTYSDTGQNRLYVEWCDHHGKLGRTEGRIDPDGRIGSHMQALLDRAKRDGIAVTNEIW